MEHELPTATGTGAPGARRPRRRPWTDPGPGERTALATHLARLLRPGRDRRWLSRTTRAGAVRSAAEERRRDRLGLAPDGRWWVLRRRGHGRAHHPPGAPGRRCGRQDPCGRCCHGVSRTAAVRGGRTPARGPVHPCPACPVRRDAPGRRLSGGGRGDGHGGGRRPGVDPADVGVCREALGLASSAAGPARTSPCQRAEPVAQRDPDAAGLGARRAVGSSVGQPGRLHPRRAVGGGRGSLRPGGRGGRRVRRVPTTGAPAGTAATSRARTTSGVSAWSTTRSCTAAPEHAVERSGHPSGAGTPQTFRSGARARNPGRSVSLAPA